MAVRCTSALSLIEISALNLLWLCGHNRAAAPAINVSTRMEMNNFMGCGFGNCAGGESKIASCRLTFGLLVQALECGDINISSESKRDLWLVVKQMPQNDVGNILAGNEIFLG